MNYYDWAKEEQRCNGCGWAGMGDEAKIRESFSDGIEYECPNCANYFGYVAFPLLSESITDQRAPRADKIFAKIALSGANKDDCEAD